MLKLAKTLFIVDKKHVMWWASHADGCEMAEECSDCEQSEESCRKVPKNYSHGPKIGTFCCDFCLIKLFANESTGRNVLILAPHCMIQSLLVFVHLATKSLSQTLHYSFRSKLARNLAFRQRI